MPVIEKCRISAQIIGPAPSFEAEATNDAQLCYCHPTLPDHVSCFPGLC